MWPVTMRGLRVHACPSFGSRKSGRRSKAPCQGFAAAPPRFVFSIVSRVRALDRATRRHRISYRMRSVERRRLAAWVTMNRQEYLDRLMKVEGSCARASNSLEISAGSGSSYFGTQRAAEWQEEEFLKAIEPLWEPMKRLHCALGGFPDESGLLAKIFAVLRDLNRGNDPKSWCHQARRHFVGPTRNDGEGFQWLISVHAGNVRPR